MGKIGVRAHRTGVCMALSALVGLSLLTGCGHGGRAGKDPGKPEAAEAARRRGQFAQAATIGAHAYHIQLHRKDGKGDAEAFGPQGLSDEEIDRLVKLYTALALIRPAEAADWADGKPSRLDPSKIIDPLLGSRLKLDERLPVSVARRFFTAKAPDAPPEQRLALANLVQVCFENDRESKVPQRMFRVYEGLGVLRGPADFGVPDDNTRFLEEGTKLAAETCQAPYATDAKAWQLQLRKVQNLSLIHRGIATEKTLATELLATGEVKTLLPRIRTMPAQHIVVIGHSYTVNAGWTTPGVFNYIVEEIFKRENPSVAFKHLTTGGLRATKARDLFLAKALLFKPNRVLLCVGMGSEEDCEAMNEMVLAFRKVGAEVTTFDRMVHTIPRDRPPRPRPYLDTWLPKLAQAGLVTIELGQLLDAHPEKDTFLSLDGSHMRGNYHKFVAAEWLKYLVGARGARLAAD
ncbi:MAG TPA: hypothetical protein VMZ92_00665 [Planctomycetota bacterium]|nr:hypothetical protein [Planctomycetota bacterium]